jgi:sugar transferase (PEP-CTERM/EpsH1 system associated)
MRSSRPQILMLVHRVPFPPNRGDRIRSFHFLRFLAQQGDVWLATLADEPLAEGTCQALAGLCREVAIAHLGRSRWLRGAWSLARGRSATEGLFASPALRQTLRRWARQVRWDVAFVFCSSTVPYLELPELADVPAIVDLVDVDSQKFFDYSTHSWGLKRWLYQIEGRRLRRLEASLASRASALVLVSEPEADLYRQICPHAAPVVVPNGVDTDYFDPAPQNRAPWRALPAADRTSVVFVGALDYRANVDGVCWFVREIWPEVRKALPAFTLGLVGRRPVPAVRRLALVPGVRVFADVPDVRPYLAAADLAIAPLRIARGIQNKVLEALAMGKAVVASPPAAVGLEASEAEGLVVARSPADWVAALRRLALSSHTAAGRDRAIAARAWVVNHYSWPRAFQKLRSVLPIQAAAGSPAGEVVGGWAASPQDNGHPALLVPRSAP